MKILRIALVTAAIGGVSGTETAVAQSAVQAVASAETLQAATELVSLISPSTIETLTYKITAEVWPAIESDLRAQNPKIDAATLRELRKEYEQMIVDSIPEVMNDSAAIYARYFTAQDLREMTAFYRTPAGERALKLMPLAFADLVIAMTPRLPALQEKVNTAFLNILQKRGYNSR